MPDFFDLPLDLTHAGNVALRLLHLIQRDSQSDELLSTAESLHQLLLPYAVAGENPEDEEASRVQLEAIELGRQLVLDIVRAGAGTDRIGQNVRNLFECLSRGEEGLRLSLDAGENPNSLLRP